MKAWGREPALTSDQADLLPIARLLTGPSRSPEKELKRMKERKKKRLITGYLMHDSCTALKKIYTREMLARECSRFSLLLAALRFAGRNDV